MLLRILETEGERETEESVFIFRSGRTPDPSFRPRLVFRRPFSSLLLRPFFSASLREHFSALRFKVR